MFYRIVQIVLWSMVLFTACQPGKVALTFTEDIAPIVHRKCTPCHLSEEAAPFELLYAEDFTKRQKLIRYMVSKRLMPPWPADPTYSHFANELYLTDDEIGRILSWMDQGFNPGDTAIRYSASSIRKKNALGEPDHTIPVPRVSIPGNNTDLFLVMKIPVQLKQDTFIRAIEFVPGNKKLVHHVNTHLISFEPDKKTNLESGKDWVNQDQTNSMQIHRELGLLQDDGTYPRLTPSVSNYLPGSMFTAYPRHIGGYRMKRKSAFYLNDFHYGPSPVPASDSSFFRIYFDDRPPEREIKEFQLGTLGITPVVPELVIPPGEVRKFYIRSVVPNDISIVTMVPHMHLIGKKFRAFAVKPSGDTIPLIRINSWDFRWQYFYHCKKLIHLPRGSIIYVEGEYDNTAENPNNPFDPPREIRDREGSMRTTDEMFQFIVTYVDYQPGDEQIVVENIHE